MRIKLVYGTNKEEEVIITMNCIPRLGEKVQLDESEPAEVREVMYTPWSAEQQAIVTLRRVKL